jgi:hypothetical protein
MSECGCLAVPQLAERNIDVTRANNDVFSFSRMRRVAGYIACTLSMPNQP